MDVELAGVNEEYRTEIENTIKLMQYEYPVLQEIIGIIHLSNTTIRDTYASCRLICKKKLYYEIQLNNKYLSKADIEHEFSKDRIMYEANYYSLQDIIIHEMGHALQGFYLCKKLHINLKLYKFFYRINFTLLENENKVDRIWTKYFSKFENINYKLQLLGNGAMQNPKEILPECYNNYYRLKNKSKLDVVEQETYEFVKAVVDDYKKYIPNEL